MAGSNGNSVFRHLRLLLGANHGSDLSDGQLLKRFIEQRDEDAFSALVRRHGKLVLGVCRRVLNHAQDAEDVFQATFLILARKARSIRRREAIGSWLYQTAYRLALKMRLRAQQERSRQERTAAAPQPNPVDDVSWREVRDIIDEEIAGLPDKYRAAILLCYFEGRTQEDAARQLGWPARTLQARLARGLQMMRGRLGRRGLPLGAALLTTLLAGEGAGALAHVPMAVVCATCQAAGLSAAGMPITGTVSKAVIKIVEGAVRQMVAVKMLKLTLAAVLLTVFTGSGLGLVFGLASPAPAAPGLDKTADLEQAKDTQRDKKPALPPLLDGEGEALPAGAYLRLGTQKMRHGGSVLALDWTPDSLWIAAGGTFSDFNVRLWDATNGNEIRHFPMHQSGICTVAVAPQGGRAISVDEEGKLYLWSTESATVLKEAAQVFRAAPVVFAENGKSFVTINDKGLVTFMETDSLEPLREVQDKAKRTAPLAALAWSKDGKLLATLDAMHKVKIVDVLFGKVQHTLEDAGEVTRVSFSPDGKKLATAGKQKTVDLWDSATGKLIGRLEGHLGSVTSLSWLPSGKKLASSGDDATVRIWDTEKGQELLRLTSDRTTGKGAMLLCVAFSPDGKRVAAGGAGKDTTVHVWDAETGKEMVKDDHHVGWIGGLALAGGGKMLVTCGQEGKIRLWDIATGKVNNQFLGLQSRPKAIAVANGGKMLAAGGGDGAIRLFDLPGGQLVKVLKAPNKAKATVVNCVEFSPDGKRLASGNSAKTFLWSIATGETILQFNHPAEQTFAMAFSPDGKMLCTGSANGKLRLWDATSGAEIASWEGHRGVMERIVFSPDSKLVATANQFFTAVWDVATTKLHRNWPGWDVGYTVAFSPDGRTLATGSKDQRIHLWELATNQQRAVLVGHRGAVCALKFLPDGKTLVSASIDGTALCWDLTGQRTSQPQPAKKLTVQELEDEWKHLHSPATDEAYQALLKLAADPQSALPKLRQHLKPVAPIDPKLIAQWIAELDDKKTPVREKAGEELKKAAELAWPALNKVLENPPSLELQTRVRQILGKDVGKRDDLLPTVVPERLWQTRSLELLERLGTPDARKLIQTLAEGAPDAWLTQEAKMMLERRP